MTRPSPAGRLSALALAPFANPTRRLIVLLRRTRLSTRESGRYTSTKTGSSSDRKPGRTFVRIGIGTVRKPDEAAYRPFETYEIVDPGKWTIHKHQDRIEFRSEARPDVCPHWHWHRSQTRRGGLSSF